MSLTMGSLFDGIGGFPLAASHVGIKTLWASEIEKFPIQVTMKHFPEMVHVGDITKLNGADLPPVDIVCGGSPCQDYAEKTEIPTQARNTHKKWEYTQNIGITKTSPSCIIDAQA